MKKILGVLLAGAVALTCFTACNSSTQENSSTTTDGASEAASQEENSETEAATIRLAHLYDPGTGVATDDSAMSGWKRELKILKRIIQVVL